MWNIDQYKDWKREDLVKEYIETRYASVINCIGTDWHAMPKDAPKDPAYWKAKDKDMHTMHYAIAAKYGISRDDCLWLMNVATSDEMYIFDYKLKAVIKNCIDMLEKLEEKAKNGKSKADR